MNSCYILPNPLTLTLSPVWGEGQRRGGNGSALNAFVLVVEKSLLVELKAVETVLPLHHAQVLTYLKLSGLRLGLLINFNVPMIRDGIKRFAL